MTCPQTDLTRLSDVALLANVEALAARERHATAELIAALAELDACRLYLGQGCASLFTYCTQVLHLSEHAAYGRIEAARAARRFPIVPDLLADGAVTLTTIGLLAPHLTPENHRDLLEASSHKSKREVELIVAALRPQPTAPAVVRKLPAPKNAGALTSACGRPNGGASCEVLSDPPASAPAARRAVVSPLAPERYKIQFTASRELYENLRRAQDLLRHVIPNGDLAAVFDRALTALVADLERRKHARVNCPRAPHRLSAGSRQVPAEVKRQVWARDGGRCAFIGARGRCAERGFLEFHHVKPFADGGRTTAGNIQLRCRAHNRYEAEQYFWSEQEQCEVVRERAPGPQTSRVRQGRQEHLPEI